MVTASSPTGKKPARKAFAEFRPHVAGVLDQPLLSEIDMLQFQRRERAVAGPGQEGQRDDSPVALFDLGCGGHGPQDVKHLLKAREGPLAFRLGDANVLFGEREIVGVGI